jgi:hypothetical protein
MYANTPLQGTAGLFINVESFQRVISEFDSSQLYCQRPIVPWIADSTDLAGYSIPILQISAMSRCIAAERRTSPDTSYTPAPESWSVTRVNPCVRNRPSRFLRGPVKQRAQNRRGRRLRSGPPSEAIAAL